MSAKTRILVVDDDEEDYFLLQERIFGQTRSRTSPAYKLDWVSTYEAAVAAIADCRYDVYLVDYQLGSHTGLDLLREAVERNCPSPIIMLTGRGDYDTDLAAMRLGAADYIEKSQLTLPLLERSIRYAIERRRIEKQLEDLLQERTRDLALMKKQAQELAALQKATATLLQTLDLSRLIGQILDAAQEAIPTAERSWLHLVERQYGRGRKLTEIPLDDARVRWIKPSTNLRGPLKAIQDGRSLLVADLQAEPLLRALLKHEEERRTVRGAIITPLVVGQEVVGALSLNASRPSLFSEDDRKLLTSFAATASAALQNAMLYSETQDLATTDPLTGQPNRRTFFELAHRELERYQRFGRPLSWMMFDVDLFKEINDQFGHSVGDQVLIAIVDRCCEVVRHVDVLGRYGGDEFVILLPETDHQSALEVAERLRAAIHTEPIPTDAGPVTVSVSIGITETTPASVDIGLLLNKADQALYKSKRAGRNTITVVV